MKRKKTANGLEREVVDSHKMSVGTNMKLGNENLIVQMRFSVILVEKVSQTKKS